MEHATRRAFRPLAIVGMFIAAIGIAFASIASANAVIITDVTPFAGLPASGTASVTVTFDSDAGEAFYAVAECNADEAEGLACRTGAVGLISIPTTPATYSQALTVSKTYANTSLIPGQPAVPGSTSCRGTSALDRCVIAVSTYDSAGQHMDTDYYPLRFL